MIFLATSREVMQVNELNKEIKFRSKIKAASHQQTLWIGLKLNPSVKNLKDISFYFGTGLRIQTKVTSLSYSKFPVGFIVVTKLLLKAALVRKLIICTKDISIEKPSFLDVNAKTEKIVNGFFKDCFITICSDLAPETGTFPSVFNDFFASEDLEK